MTEMAFWSFLLTWQIQKQSTSTFYSPYECNASYKSSFPFLDQMTATCLLKRYTFIHPIIILFSKTES